LAQPVASNASRISMISLSDFFTVPPVRRPERGQRPRALPRRDPLISDRHDRSPTSAEREISRPRRGRRSVRLQGCWTVRCHEPERRLTNYLSTGAQVSRLGDSDVVPENLV
jgi:hypothetical protein